MSSPASRARLRGVRLVARAVMEVLQAADTEIVGNCDTGEAELHPEQLGQELGRAVEGQAVDFVVGRHDGADSGLVDDGAKWCRNDVAQMPRAQ